MNKKLKNKWVKALRSGDYDQGTRWLCVINKETGNANYCCLGVLAELHDGEDVWKVGHSARFRRILSNGRLTPHSPTQKTFLSDAQFREMGLTFKQASKLADFNDNGRSFNWIASYIERYL